MPATSRWLKTWMSTPARTSECHRSACKSEKARTRSGSSARIFGMSAEINADTRGFSRPTCRGRPAAPGGPGGPPRLAKQIQRFDGFLGETHDPVGRELMHG